VWVINYWNHTQRALHKCFHSPAYL